MSTSKILVILGSTRQGRMGERIAEWFLPLARSRDDLIVEYADLREWQLPYYEESLATAKGTYAESVKPWADLVGASDGFVIITAEYNHGYTAVLKTALDALGAEWHRKPVAFISYGGWAAGTRAAQQLRQVTLELQMVPIRGTVAFQFARRLFDADGQLQNAEFYGSAANTMLDELAWWANLLGEARQRG